MQMIRTHPQNGSAAHPAADGRSESKESISRISPENRVAECSSDRRSEQKYRVPAWSPLTATASVSQKTHRMPLSADSGPRQAPQCGSSRNAEAPAARKQILPCTARAVRLFCGELLSVREKRPGSAAASDAAAPQAVPLRGNRSSGRSLPLNYTRFRQSRQV